MQNITVWTHFQQQLVTLRQHSWFGAALAGAIGLVVFALVLGVLLFGGPRTTPATPPVVDQQHEPNPTPIALAADNSPPLAAQISANHLGATVSLSPDASPLSDVHVGSVLDVLVTLPEGPDGPGMVRLVVAGARVLQLQSSPGRAVALLDVDSDAAVQLGHLVRSGLSLTYISRQGAGGPRDVPVMTTDEARARLGLAPRVPVATPVPTAAPAEPHAPADVSEVHFVAYPGANLAIVEQRFEVDEQALLSANPELTPTSELAPGLEVVVPDLFGFLYHAQSSDTWDVLSARYQVSSERLQRLNAWPTLQPGVGLLIPAPRPAWAVTPARDILVNR